MLTNLTARVLTVIVKKSRLEMMAEVEEIIERDGESCAQSVALELNISIQEATSLIRGLCAAEGVFKSDKRLRGMEMVQFYTFKRPRNTQASLLPERAVRDPLVAALFGDA